MANGRNIGKLSILTMRLATALKKRQPHKMISENKISTHGKYQVKKSTEWPTGSPEQKIYRSSVSPCSPCHVFKQELDYLTTACCSAADVGALFSEKQAEVTVDTLVSRLTHSLSEINIFKYL